MPPVEDNLVRLRTLIRTRNYASFNRENNPSITIPGDETIRVDIFGWKAYNIYIENTGGGQGTATVQRLKDIFDPTVREQVTSQLLASGEVITISSDTPGVAVTISNTSPNGGTTMRATVVKVA